MHDSSFLTLLENIKVAIVAMTFTCPELRFVISGVRFGEPSVTAMARAHLAPNVFEIGVLVATGFGILLVSRLVILELGLFHA